MSKTRFRILPNETYTVAVGNHNEEIQGIDILAILEAAFDEATEEVDFIHHINEEELEKLSKLRDSHSNKV